MTYLILGDMAEQPPINLVRGWPSTSLLPISAISEAAQHVLADPAISHPGLLYGPDEGFAPLRESVGDFLNEFYQPEGGITKERIVISGGASQNMGCVLQVFTDPLYTQSIQIVTPAYMLSFRIFEDHGFAGKMRAVPEDEDGVDVQNLRRSLEASEDRGGSNDKPSKPKRPYSKYYRHIIYCVPTFSNPSSRTMTTERRKELIQCARDFDALIIADDVYDWLQWPADTKATAQTAMKKASFPRLVDLDRTLEGGVDRAGADGFGNALSNGSFSKICGPGIRVGWCEGAPPLTYGISQAGTTCSGGAPSQLTSTYVDRLLRTGGIQGHIFNVLQPAYSRRYKTLVQAVQAELGPLGVTLPQQNRAVVGGYFIWLTLPAEVNAEELAQRCQEEGRVIIAPGSIFEVPGDDSVSFGQGVRLTFSWVDPVEMVQGVQRMKTVLESMLRGDVAKTQFRSQKGLGQIK